MYQQSFPPSLSDLLPLFVPDTLLFYRPDSRLIRNLNSGSTTVLIDVAGQDCTEAYDDAEHSDEAHDILKDLEIGTLSTTDAIFKDTLVPQRTTTVIEVAKEAINRVLKPDVFQEFELQEKTRISDNVAM